MSSQSLQFPGSLNNCNHLLPLLDIQPLDDRVVSQSEFRLRVESGMPAIRMKTRLQTLDLTGEYLCTMRKPQPQTARPCVSPCGEPCTSRSIRRRMCSKIRLVFG